MAFFKIKTFLPDNKFKFNCPIFGAEVQIRQCFNLRDEWAKGRQIPQRRGCQACLSASKCPIVKIIKDIQINPEQNDVYFSDDDTKVGKLRPNVLEAIAPVMVMKSTLNMYQPITPAQMACIEAVDGLKGVAAIAKNSGLKAGDLEAVIEKKMSVYDYQAPSTPQPKKERVIAQPKVAEVRPDASDYSGVVNSLMAKEEAV